MPIDLYVEPPEPTVLTDEESGNEDDDVVDIRHLPGRQLLAPAEIIIGATASAMEWNDGILFVRWKDNRVVINEISCKSNCTGKTVFTRSEEECDCSNAFDD